MTSPAVVLRGVGKQYPGDPPTQVLEDIELAVEPGELAAVVGPSGSGKTTLLNILGTLDRPTAGEVEVAGRATSDLDDAALSALRAHSIGFVFQHFYLLTGLPALDNVADGLLYRGVALAERRARAAEVLEQVGLGHRLHHDPSRLSGGERQRVAIARALVGRPTVVLADEPTGNLDSKASEDVVELLRELNRAGTTILVITHDRDIASSLPRRITLSDGRIVDDSRPVPLP